MPIPNEPALAGRTLTFDEDFNSLSLRTGAAGTGGHRWKTSFYGEWRTLPGNKELEYYVDPDFKGKTSAPLGLNPFSIDNGILKISARPTDPAVLPKIWNAPYTSGLLTTQTSFQQQYGYFEIRADVPSGKGLWPAFWMLAPAQWPPEIDIFETLGHKPTWVSQGMFTKTGPHHGKYANIGVDVTTGFHTYGMEWTPQTITWFIDGKQNFKVATPADMHQPMYVLLNLAVGGKWPGKPDGSVDWSKADLLVDYVRVYSLDKSGPSPAPTPHPTPAPSAATLAVSQGDDKPFTDLKITGANTSTAYKIAHPGSGPADVTVSFDAQKDLVLVNLDHWNAVKNALVKNIPGTSVTVKNFVDVDITTGGADNDILVSGAKRGTISTGGGNDDVTVSGHSNSLTSNVTKVIGGLGDDTVTYTGNGANKAQLDGGDGNDWIKLDGHASGTLLGGRGNDKLIDYSERPVTLTGGSGQDIFAFGKDAHATVTDFAAGVDQVKLIGVLASQVHVSHPGNDTLLDLGGGGSVRLLGVHPNQAQLDIHYG